ncbi:MAG: hypothetical protein M3076_07810 [Actinomycetota bacterium]|nr:hypothetical protein [Actinomycetota bacterium]
MSVAPEIVSPGSFELKATLSPGTGSPARSVTSAVTEAIEDPLAGIAAGPTDTTRMLDARPYCVRVAVAGASTLVTSAAVIVEAPGVVEEVIVEV